VNAAPARYQTVTGATSLVLGPAMMSVGDLIHPPETWNAAAQVAIVGASALRWYGAHLLLFIGMLLFVPGQSQARGRVCGSPPAARLDGRPVSRVRL
jgi:hypothetical protein